MKTISINASQAYDVVIERGILHDCGKYLRPLLPGSKLLVATEDRVAPLYLDRVLNSLRRAGFEAESFISLPANFPQKYRHLASADRSSRRIRAHPHGRRSGAWRRRDGRPCRLCRGMLPARRALCSSTTLLAAVDSSISSRAGCGSAGRQESAGRISSALRRALQPGTAPKNLAPATLAEPRLRRGHQVRHVRQCAPARAAWPRRFLPRTLKR